MHEVKSDQFQSEDSDSDSDFYVDTVNTSFSHYDQTFATVNIGPKKTPIKFKIDTGSQVNIIPLSTFRELNIKITYAMTNDISDFVLKCDICLQYRASNT